MKLGIISDTHNFLDPQISRLFQGVEHILHAGDIGSPRIILELEQIAPVTAVLGNTDDPGLHYHQTETLVLADQKFLLHHIVDPHALDDSLKQCLAREKPDVVVFGHTHKPFCQTVGGIFYFNPGYAGKSRFGMDRSVAVLDCTKEGIRTEYHPL
jgi:putative phosphoesterase